MLTSSARSLFDLAVGSWAAPLQPHYPGEATATAAHLVPLVPSPHPSTATTQPPFYSSLSLKDPLRAEDAATSSAEVDGTLRDWSEELQSLRELPRATFDDRITRERALFKVCLLSCVIFMAAVAGFHWH